MTFKNLLIGKYYHRDSFIHNLDPRTKLVSLFLIFLAVTLASNIFFLAGILFLLFLVVFLSDIPIVHFIKHLFPFLWIILITFFLHIIFTDGRILIQIPGIGFNITYEGFYNGTFYGFRILLLLAFSNLFMLTTSPIDITDGMELLFNPLKKLKIPIDKFALIISISLRFIPTIFEETERIKKAQVARGAGIEKSIIKRLKKITTIIIPVFISIFRRADELAVALETRWYPPIGKRTYYRDINLKTKDFLVLFAIFFISGGVLFLDKYLFG